MNRVQKALLELDYLEEILDVAEAPDFVEIVGKQGGDVETTRVYFKDDDTVDYVCCR